MQVLNTIVSWFLRQRYESIIQAAKNPIETQERLLKYLLQTAENTEWGKKYRFCDIGDYNDFREAVPLQDYDSLKPYIERTMAGEQNLLWPSEILWFAKSSGTTSDKSKFIPVSTEALNNCHLKGGQDALSLFCKHHPETSLFSGKGLIMGGSTTVYQLNEETSYGDVSGVMMKNMPLIAHAFNTPDLHIALMEDWEEKLERMAEITVDENITNLAGVATWTLVLIRKILEKTGKNNLLEVWPNLQLYIHGGVSFEPYREQFRQLIPSEDMHYMETYNASEGFFAIQDSETMDMLLLLNNGVFYEFIPIENIHDKNAKVVTLEDVEVGKNYAMVISTNAGLWRYLIGDTIQFTSTFPFKIQISGRTKHYINAFGEEVIIDNASKAITLASLQTGSTVADYTAAPIYFEGDKKGGHEWLIEFEKPPEDIQAFILSLDEALKSVNSDYEAKRFKDIALQLPVVHVLPKGTFYDWLKSKDKLGGQHKVPRLCNDRRYVDEILRFVEK